MHEINKFDHINGMTSLEIAEVTGKQHQHVLRDIDGILRQGVDASNFGLTSYTDSSNRKQRMYNLTPKGCLILASGYDVVLREKIINRLEELEMEKKGGGFLIPQTFSEALMLAAKQQEKIEEQQRLIAENKPKAEFFDAVTDSKDAIEMKAVSNVLNFKNIGRNKLFDILRCNKILTERNLPMQRYIDCGYFRTIEQKYSKPNGDICINIKTVVYQTGVAFIRKVLMNLGYTSK